MNPYEVSQTSSDTIQSLLESTQKLQGCDGDGGGGAAAQLKHRLLQLQQVHSRSWHILRHNNEHAAFVMARLESMDVLCARLVPAMDAARAILARRKIGGGGGGGSDRSSTWYAFLRNRSLACFYCASGGGGGGGARSRDGLLECVDEIARELGSWLDYQEGILELLSCQAFGVAPRLQASALEGYQPLAKLMRRIGDALVSGAQRCVIVHGPSGAGKSSLAAYAAANPPECFSDGAVEISVGKIAGSGEGYERALRLKLVALLRELNCQKELIHRAGSARDCWLLLEEVVAESSYLIVLDNVLDGEIIDRVIQMKSHSSKFLVTCQDNPLWYECESVLTIKLGFRDTACVSRDILRFHSGLPGNHLPAVASKLLKHCSHHPLAVAILGEALRGSWRREEWIAVASRLDASSGNRLNWLAGVMSTMELSVLGMDLETQSLFNALASLSWKDPIPVECLQALWSALGKKSSFLLHARELVRRCLLKRSPDFLQYELHELVAIFLERKSSSAVDELLNLAKSDTQAIAAPWLLHFGNDKSRKAAAGSLRGVLALDDEELLTSSLASIVDVFKACAALGRKEEIRREMNAIVGAEIVRLLSRASSLAISAAIARYLAACFAEAEYEEFGRGAIAAGLIDKLRSLLSSSGAAGINVLVKREAAEVLARLAGIGGGDRLVAECLIRADVLRHLVALLDAQSGWIHDGVLAAVVKIAALGDPALRQLLATDFDERLLLLLRNRKQVAKARALGAFEALARIGGARVVDRLVAAGILDEIEVLLNCACEDVQLSACVLCKEVLARSPAIVERVLRTRLVETLTGLLGDELQLLRSRAAAALQILVHAHGKAVTDRIGLAAGEESFQGNELAKRLVKSIVE